ncbi:MAG: hypothetical protein R3F60_08405 [bacterium]
MTGRTGSRAGSRSAGTGRRLAACVRHAGHRRGRPVEPGGKLYRSDGRGGLRRPVHVPSRPTALTVGPGRSRPGDGRTPPAWQRVWVGFIDGSVQVSADGGHFRRLVPGGVGPVLDIALDPTDVNRVVAVWRLHRPLGATAPAMCP